jgi:hypothetical protein
VPTAATGAHAQTFDRLDLHDESISFESARTAETPDRIRNIADCGRRELHGVALFVLRLRCVAGARIGDIARASIGAVGT